MADQIFYGFFSLHPFDSDYSITELTTLHDHQLLCFYEIRWAGNFKFDRNVPVLKILEELHPSDGASADFLGIKSCERLCQCRPRGPEEAPSWTLGDEKSLVS